MTIALQPISNLNAGAVKFSPPSSSPPIAPVPNLPKLALIMCDPRGRIVASSNDSDQEIILRGGVPYTLWGAVPQREMRAADTKRRHAGIPLQPELCFLVVGSNLLLPRDFSDTRPFIDPDQRPRFGALWGVASTALRIDLAPSDIAAIRISGKHAHHRAGDMAVVFLTHPHP